MTIFTILTISTVIQVEYGTRNSLLSRVTLSYSLRQHYFELSFKGRDQKFLCARKAFTKVLRATPLTPYHLCDRTAERMRSPPARYVLALLVFFGLANVYALRVNLSVAIVRMQVSVPNLLCAISSHSF